MTVASFGLRAAGACLLLHAAVAAAQVHEGKTIVTARLVADTTAVQSGRDFTAAVHLAIEPGWHVYWENPGDTALPVLVKWNLPEGFAASPIRWPLPERYQEGEGVTVFGYEREALLLSTIDAPRSIPSDSVTLMAKAEWLVCEKLCIPGEANLSLNLPVGAAAQSENAAMIRKFAATVPRSNPDVRISSVRTRNDAERWYFTVNLDTGGRKTVRFLPRSIPLFLIEHGGIKVQGNTVEFTALPDEPDANPSRLSGVVVTDRGSFDVSADPSSSNEPASGILPAPSPQPPPTPDARRPAPEDWPDARRPTPDDDWLNQPFNVTGASTDLSLLTLVLFGVLGGLLLNVMPCVLPVIALKIMGFVQQAGQDRARTRALGLMFGAGVIVSFWILVAAVALIRATVEQVGWGFQFQSPGFVIAMSVIVLIFALNLFGTFEIAGPSMSRVPAGAFLQGMFTTVLATPCTAPFLGTAIGFAFTQSLPVLFLAFTAAGVGLALPYVLLSLNPGWMRWLPRPGAWMIRFKQAMGFVLLATVVWLLAVLGAQLGPEGVVWTLVFLTIVAFATWLLGQYRHIGVRFAAVALVAGGYVWALENELRWREPVADPVSPVATDGIQWEKFSLAEVSRRVRSGETVFIDFTADWCWNCKVNERTVLSTDAVEQRMRDLEITAVKADWTRRNPEITRMLAKFGRVGVPFYVVFPARRLSEPIALSEVITRSSVIEALEKAGPSQR